MPRERSGTIPSMETHHDELKDNTIIIALFGLFRQNFLPRDTKIVGYARTKMDKAEFDKRATGYIKGADDNPEIANAIESFKQHLSYVAGGYEDGESFDKLNEHLEAIESTYVSQQECNRIFYLALPPTVFIPVAQNLKEHCYNPKGGVNRIIIEKPFGKDLDSARTLLTSVKKFWTEDETFRIDHYLGKEMVKNLLVLRFANIAMGAAWDKNSISNVQITFKEPFGTEGRGGYFDEFGMIRDVLQNHLLQVKVLRAIPPIEKEDTLLGQYVAANGKPGYLDDSTVPPNSICPTFAATTLWIHNPRWEALNEAKVEVRIQFKDVTQGIFKDIARNELVIRIQPSEAVYLKLNAKTPGLYTRAFPTEMDLTYKRRFAEAKIPEAYESLILDALRGDHSNFVRNDELDFAWKIFTPILHWIDGKNGQRPKPLPYPYGSRGPKELDDFIKKNGYRRSEGA
ncbi:hypothetical protein EST38_g609 [Candolleomyces aberdarensis]|uniref:Glucose-6-phosphate 1-dehydrogenase n=1 Tax=Candolleomyces aberdarensis TaxID=2316362 RepID=A0A4Q2E1J1_9AGAR|nr:hypothetical protein EST38_g609 [Candolleomyces aberdarensis]